MMAPAWMNDRKVCLEVGLAVYVASLLACVFALLRFLQLNRHPIRRRLLLLPFRDYDSEVMLSEPSMASQKLFVHVVLLLGYSLCTITYAAELTTALRSPTQPAQLVDGLWVVALFGFYVLYFFAFAMVLYQWGSLLVMPELGGVLLTVGAIALLPRLLLGFSLVHASLCLGAVVGALTSYHRQQQQVGMEGGSWTYRVWYWATIGSRVALSLTFLAVGVLLYRRVRAVFGSSTDKAVLRMMRVLVLCLLVCVSCFLLNAAMVYLTETHQPSAPQLHGRKTGALFSLFLRQLTRNWIPNTVPLIPLLYLNRIHASSSNHQGGANENDEEGFSVTSMGYCDRATSFSSIGPPAAQPPPAAPVAMGGGQGDDLSSRILSLRAIGSSQHLSCFHSGDSLADHQNQVSNIQTTRAGSHQQQLSSSSSLQSEGGGGG